MKNILEIEKDDFDESKVVDLYIKLGIDTTNTLGIDELGKEYQDLINAMESECYSTTAYVNR